MSIQSILLGKTEGFSVYSGKIRLADPGEAIDIA
jgi:hypothetical protein